MLLATPTIGDGSVASQTSPERIALSEDARQLTIALASGQTISLHAERLRAACRCAHCRRAHYDDTFPLSFDGVAIERCEPMGHYGVNIVFSDGHARGIFPWSYLASLSEDGGISPVSRQDGA
jgi:prepilin-type processing-associated H-X9-DG protein